MAFFGLQALAMRTLGRLSHGIRLGWETGFNSGDSLDYVYRNRPSGLTWFGRLIDKVYLNFIGWRGIRLRKESLKQWILAAAAQLRNEGREARIMDVAAGHGRYLLEVKRVLGDGVKVLFRGSSHRLAAGRRNDLAPLPPQDPHSRGESVKRRFDASMNRMPCQSVLMFCSDYCVMEARVIHRTGKAVQECRLPWVEDLTGRGWFVIPAVSTKNANLDNSKIKRPRGS
jgi:hypothetical protein